MVNITESLLLLSVGLVQDQIEKAGTLVAFVGLFQDQGVEGLAHSLSLQNPVNTTKQH